MGIDYRIGSHFAIGLTGGYAYTHADLFNGSSIAVNGGKLGLYATAFGSGFYLDTAVVGGLSGYDTRRTALEGTARRDTLGGDLNGGCWLRLEDRRTDYRSHGEFPIYTRRLWRLYRERFACAAGVSQSKRRVLPHGLWHEGIVRFTF